MAYRGIQASSADPLQFGSTLVILVQLWFYHGYRPNLDFQTVLIFGPLFVSTPSIPLVEKVQR